MCVTTDWVKTKEISEKLGYSFENFKNETQQTCSSDFLNPRQLSLHSWEMLVYSTGMQNQFRTANRQRYNNWSIEQEAKLNICYYLCMTHINIIRSHMYQVATTISPGQMEKHLSTTLNSSPQTLELISDAGDTVKESISGLPLSVRISRIWSPCENPSIGAPDSLNRPMPTRLTVDQFWLPCRYSKPRWAFIKASGCVANTGRVKSYWWNVSASILPCPVHHELMQQEGWKTDTCFSTSGTRRYMLRIFILLMGISTTVGESLREVLVLRGYYAIVDYWRRSGISNILFICFTKPRTPLGSYRAHSGGLIGV